MQGMKSVRMKINSGWEICVEVLVADLTLVPQNLTKKMKNRYKLPI
jgi:hypothetical protein